MIIASTTCGITATSARQLPASTMASPNTRRRDTSRATRGPSAMPSPRPTKTVPNSIP